MPSKGSSADLLREHEEQKLRESISLLEGKLSKTICFSSFNDVSFPEKLKTLQAGDRVDFLFAVGNLDLLNSHGIGICGSRHATPKGMDIAARTVSLLCDKELTIISGYASGVDQVAHKAALSSGGCTIIVLPEGLKGFSVRKDLRDVWDWQRVLLLSQFGIETSWRAWNAMKRNRTIMALSDAMLVVEARATGGTFDAGTVSLNYGKPVFAVDYSETEEASAGNRVLIEHGAIPLKKSRQSGDPSVEPIVAAALGA